MSIDFAVHYLDDLLGSLENRLLRHVLVGPLLFDCSVCLLASCISWNVGRFKGAASLGGECVV